MYNSLEPRVRSFPLVGRRRHGAAADPWRIGSVFRQVVVQLPLRYLRDVLLPFHPLRGEELGGDVLAQSVLDNRVLLELVARFLEVVWKIVDSETSLFPVRHLPDVGVHRLACIGFVDDSVETRRELHRESEIRIGGRIGDAELASGSESAAV